jgi:hypothetical protein
MTIASDLSRQEHVTVAGVLSYAAAFEIKDKSHVLVYIDGVLKNYGTHFSIADSGVANPAGFTVVLTSDPGADLNLIILTNIPEVQSANYLASGGFPPATTESVFDKLTAYNKMQAEILRRAPKLAATSLTANITIPEPASLNLLRWNTAADDLENINIDDLNPGIGAASGEPTVLEGVITDTVVVTGLNDADYRVIVSTNWGSAANVVAKRADGFDVEFQFGPGVGGSTYEWILSRNTAAALAGVGAHDHTTADASGKLTNPEFDSYNVHELVAAPSGNPVAGKIWAWFETSTNLFKFRLTDGTTYSLGPTQAHSHTSTAGDGGVMTAPGFATYADILNIAAPGSPSANYLRVYHDIADNHFKIKNSAGTIVDISATQSIIGTYGSRGLVIFNNTSTPNTKIDFDADVVVLRNASNEIAVRYNPGAAITCDLAVFGINGRDQAGAFASSNWIHLYWLWNGTTLATRASLTAPPTGPALGGYTHWCYAGAMRLDGSGNLLRTRIQGNAAYYAQVIGILSTGQATVETGVTISGVVPPNALAGIYTVHGRMTVGAASGRRQSELAVRNNATGLTHARILLDQEMNNASASASMQVQMPSVDTTQIFYKWTLAADVTNNDCDIDCNGYLLPNGAS